MLAAQDAGKILNWGRRLAEGDFTAFIGVGSVGGNAMPTHPEPAGTVHVWLNFLRWGITLPGDRAGKTKSSAIRCRIAERMNNFSIQMTHRLLHAHCRLVCQRQKRRRFPFLPRQPRSLPAKAPPDADRPPYRQCTFEN